MLKVIVIASVFSLASPAMAVDSQTHCMAINIAKEARNQSKRGKIAIGYVTLNRAKIKYKHNYKLKICSIVYEKNQFSWTTKKQKSVVSSDDYKESYSIATKIMNGTLRDNTNNSTHFHTNRIKPKWSKGKPAIKIGDHLFYNSVATK